MKSIAINLAAAWTATIQSFVDGDIFRESNIDIQIASIADRLGYLKTLADGKASLSGSNVWTGGQTFQPSAPGQVISTLTYREAWFVDAGTSSAEALKAGQMARVHVFNDANETVNPDADVFRVPQITANRTYTINGHPGNSGRVIEIVRPRSADMFTVTIKDQAGGTVCVMPVAAVSWVRLRHLTVGYTTAAWTYVAGASNLTSVNPDV